MDMDKQPILIGGGGHYKACIDVIEASGMYCVAGVVDSALHPGQQILGYSIIGSDEDLSEIIDKYKYFLISIGQIKEYDNRFQLFIKIKKLGGIFPVIVSKFACISRYTFIDEGTIVMHHAVVNAGAKIGRNCIINTKAVVEHDVLIEDNCHISTGAVVNGGCRILKNTFVGSGAVIRQGITIGDSSVIGAGAVVVDNIPDHQLVFGVPAKPAI